MSIFDIGKKIIENIDKVQKTAGVIDQSVDVVNKIRGKGQPDNNGEAENLPVPAETALAAELTTPDQIEGTLNNYMNAIVSQKETDTNKILADMLKAQLEVVRVMKNPTLCNSAFDLLIETLNITEQELNDEKAIRTIRRRVALMINNIMFFLDAYLCYQEDKHSKEGQDLLKKGCDTLATTTNELIQEVRGNPAILRGGALGLGLVAGEKLFKSIIDQGFIAKILDFIFRKKKLEKYRADYYTFMDSAIEKLNRYKSLLGKSVVLSEFIHNQKDKTAEYFNPLPVEPEYKGVILIPTLSILGIIAVEFIILGVIALIDLTPADLSGAKINMWVAIKYSGIGDGASLVITSIVTIIRKIAYNASIKKCYKRRDVLRSHYEEIADSIASVRKE
jgi:hypothetical protein